MKKLISLLVGTLIIGAPAVHAQSSDVSWSLYTIKGEQFSVALPALPAVQTTKEIRPEKDRKRHVLKTSANGVVYIIHVVENPKPRVSLEAFIQEQARVNSLEKLTAEGDATVDGVTGKVFIYPDRKGVVEFFATEDRLYDFRAYGAPVDDAKIKTFFQYLALKKRKGNIKVSEKVQAGSFDLEADNTFKGKDVDTKARLLKKPEPTYTEWAKSEQSEGTVILKCVFAADGTVTNIRVVQGLPYGLTERAIDVARKIKFVPAMKDGKPVSMWMTLEYNFSLN